MEESLEKKIPKMLPKRCEDFVPSEPNNLCTKGGTALIYNQKPIIVCQYQKTEDNYLMLCTKYGGK